MTPVDGEATRAAFAEFGPSAEKMPDHPSVLNFKAGYDAGRESALKEAALTIEAADRLAEAGTHGYACALTVTDYEAGVKCDCGWSVALVHFLSLRGKG